MSSKNCVLLYGKHVSLCLSFMIMECLFMDKTISCISFLSKRAKIAKREEGGTSKRDLQEIPIETKIPFLQKTEEEFLSFKNQ
jgi:hypothetical protein